MKNIFLSFSLFVFFCACSPNQDTEKTEVIKIEAPPKEVETLPKTKLIFSYDTLQNNISDKTLEDILAMLRQTLPQEKLVAKRLFCDAFDFKTLTPSQVSEDSLRPILLGYNPVGQLDFVYDKRTDIRHTIYNYNAQYTIFLLENINNPSRKGQIFINPICIIKDEKCDFMLYLKCHAKNGFFSNHEELYFLKELGTLYPNFMLQDRCIFGYNSYEKDGQITSYVRYKYEKGLNFPFLAFHHRFPKDKGFFCTFRTKIRHIIRQIIVWTKEAQQKPGQKSVLYDENDMKWAREPAYLRDY